MKKRIVLAGALGLAACATAQGAVVTYTLSLNESLTCTPQTGRFTVWVSVEQATNAGLFAFGVDLKGTGDAGGPTTMTVANRTPAATYDVDDTDPNYDGGVYPSKTIGFTTGRGASSITGVVSGVQDLAQGENLIPLFGYGQTPGSLSSKKPGPVVGSQGPIPYKNAVAASNSDITWGNPCPGLPAGSARLATGTWTGSAPSFDTSVNNKASVWKLSHPNNTENEVATLQFATRIVDFPDLVTLTNTSAFPNQAVGGAILVSGSNGGYVSEVDQLLDPSVNRGSAPIQSIGDEAGNVYVMAKLNGTAADISALLAGLNSDVDASDSQFAALHAAYDGAFGGGGFNALLKFSNTAGAKVFNWDFTAHPGVTVDQLAAVPEPGIALALLGTGAVVARRRRMR